MCLLIVEDDDALRKILQKRLTSEGYAVDSCDNGDDGFVYASSYDYDAILMDIMLPGMDGLSVLSALRAKVVSSGILLLTARDAVSDRVKGLDLGADDYLTKPFSFEELTARIRAITRKHTPSRSTVIKVGDLEMDTVAHSVRRGSRLITLTAKEYSMLEYMMRNAGQVLTVGQICDHVWNEQSSYDTNIVPVYIGYLRGKIDRNEPHPCIHTVRGFGYVLREDET